VKFWGFFPVLEEGVIRKFLNLMILSLLVRNLNSFLRTVNLKMKIQTLLWRVP
jgi:hypothetical protein